MSLLLLSLLCSLHLPLFSHARNVNDDNSTSQRASAENGAPKAENFLARAYQASVTMNGYILIDGGVISYNDSNGQITTAPDYHTHTISLLKSWTNDEIVLYQVSKASPPMNNEVLWPDREAGIIYTFGGEQSQLSSPPVPSKALWQFKLSGKGGSWSEAPDYDGFDNVPAVSGGLVAAGGYGGFVLGGYQSAQTEGESTGVVGNTAVSGMTVFNWTTRSWSTYSAQGFSSDGTAIFGAAHFLQGFSWRGVVVALGGDTANGASQWVDEVDNLVSFDKVYIFDPVHHTWYSQTTTGTVPGSRYRFCSITDSDREGTIELFVFGGSPGITVSQAGSQQQQQTQAMDEVYVLSFPSFNWQKADYSPTWPRIGHSCAQIGHGQMAVIGGVNPALTSEAEQYSTPDPWPNGVGVFDLSSMQWTNQFDRTAPNYTKPAAVQSWYSQNGKYPARWDSSELKQYFESRVPLPATPSASKPASTKPTHSGATHSSQIQSSNSPSSTPSASIVTTTSGSQTVTITQIPTATSSIINAATSSSTKSSLPPGAIAAIVLGVLVVLILLTLIFLLLRRRRSKLHTGRGGASLLGSGEDPAFTNPADGSHYGSPGSTLMGGTLGPPAAELSGSTLSVDKHGYGEYYDMKPMPKLQHRTLEAPAEVPNRISRYEMESPVAAQARSPLSEKSSSVVSPQSTGWHGDFGTLREPDRAVVRHEMPG